MFSPKFQKVIFIILSGFLLLMLWFVGSNYYLQHLQQKSATQPKPCSSSVIKTGPASGYYENHIESLDLFNVRLCFLGFEDIRDKIFPKNSLRMRIGFYDKQGELHSYPAKFGGVDNNGQTVNPSLCVPTNNTSTTCKFISLSELRTALTENTMLEAQIIYGDTGYWPASSQTKANAGTIAKLKEAIKTGVNFPKLPWGNNFVLQIWNLTKLE